MMSGNACTFPACRCEWSGRRDHCPRYGGTTKGYEPPPVTVPFEPWGHKITVHVYLAGRRQEGDTLRLIDAVNGAVPNAEFVGVDVKDIDTEPQDQVAS